MTDRVLVEFVCHPQKGHVYARVVEAPSGRKVVIPSTAYADIGPRPGTVRVRRAPVEQRLAVNTDENWGLSVLCACGRPRLLTLSQVELQLREWGRFNSTSAKPRRVVLDTTT